MKIVLSSNTPFLQVFRYVSLCAPLALLACLTGCDSGYGRTMSFNLVATGTHTNHPDVVITQVVAVVEQVAEQHGFKVDSQTVGRTNSTGRKYLCFYTRGSAAGAGRLVLDASIDNANHKVTVHIGKFHTAEREKIVEDVYSELRSRFTKEIGLDIVPSP